MYAFLTYLSVIDSERLTSVFGEMNFSNGDFIPNPFEYFIEEDSYDPPEIFEDDDLSTNFLLTAGNILSVFLINILLIAVVYPLNRLIPGKDLI